MSLSSPASRLLAIAIALSGCLQAPPESLQLDGVPSFSAEVQTPDGLLTIELRPATTIDTLPGTMDAYVLVLQETWNPEKTYTYYLDRSFHVVGLHETCSDPDQTCDQYADLRFDIRGRLPPMGILWPHLLDNDTLQVQLTRQAPVSLPIEVERKNGMTIAFTGPYPGYPARELGTQDMEGSYHYSDQSLVPATGPDFELIRLDVGSSLGAADVFPPRPVRDGIPLEPLGGMDDAPFHDDVSIRHLWDPVEAALGTQWTSHPCILGFGYDLLEQGGGSLSLAGGDVSASFTVGLDPDTARSFNVVSKEDVTGQRTAQIESTQDIDGENLCEQRMQGPAPAVSLTRLATLMEEMGKASRPIKAELRVVGTDFGRDVANGTYSYRAAFVPEASFEGGVASGYSQQIWIDASTGQLSLARMPPAHMPGP